MVEEHKHSKKVHKGHKKHKTHKKKSKTNWTAIAVGAIALIIIAYILFRGPAAPKPTDVEGENLEYGNVAVDFYVMSQCPYGTQVEDAIQPVLEEMGGNVDFNLNFIAAEDGNGGFNSLHGQEEVYGNKLHLCAQEHYPEKFMGFVVCQNKNVNSFDATLEDCAEDHDMDAEKLEDCAKGEEGTQLLSESIKKSQEVQAQGSPTIYIEEELYQGSRDPDSFKRVICSYLNNGDGEKHPSCGDVVECTTDQDCMAEAGKIGVCKNAGKDNAECVYHEDAEVTLTVLSSEDCEDCNPAELLQVLSGVFLNMEVEAVEAGSAEGKGLIEKYSLEKAPSYIFSEGISDTYAWGQNPQIPNAFREVDGDYVMLDEASGATYLLDPEARAEMQEKMGLTPGDNRPQIDFYVMSYCPYGNQAEEGIEPAYRLLKDVADFNAHFVIYSNYQSGYPQYCMDEESKYCSMHGVQEMNQGIRELCVQKHMGTGKMFDFMLAMNKECNYQNADECWEDVAEDLGLDVSVIKECESEEGEELAAEELELNQLLGVRGSPTVFVEGKAYNGARTPQGYAQALCAAFEDAPAECDAESLATLAGEGGEPLTGQC